MRRRNLFEIESFFADYDGFWNPFSLNESETSIRSKLPAGDKSINTENVNALLQAVRLCGLKNQLSEAKNFLTYANLLLADIEESEKVKLQIRYYLEEGRYYSFKMIPTRAMESFQKTWEMSHKIERFDFFAIDAAYMISITLTAKEARGWLEAAILLAEKSKNDITKKWLAYLYMAAGWQAFDRYDFNNSLIYFTKSEAHSAGEESSFAKSLQWSKARAMRALKRIDEAISTQMQILNTESYSPWETNGFVYLELAECHSSLHAFEKARDYYVLAYESLKENKWYLENYEYELNEIEKKSKKKMYS